MSVGNSTVLNTSKFVKRVGLVLSVFTTGGERNIRKLEGVGFVYYLDCGDGITGVKLYTLNVYSSLYINYTLIRLFCF